MITAQSSDVTAKRASTEEESASKKQRVEDEVDTSMEDDSSDSYAWEVKAKDEDEEEEEVGPKNYVIDMPEEEPEWDKDSYDGKECEFDPPKRFATDEDYNEYRKYRTHLWNHRGFLPDPFSYIIPILNLDGPFRNKTNREYFADVACLCVKKLNEEKGSSVEFVSIVRGNLKGGGRWNLYITFMAREYPEGPLVEYQAKAMDCAGGKIPPFPILCRRSPLLTSYI